MLRSEALCVCEKVNNSDDRQASRRQLAKLVSLCTKLANPWHGFLRILGFCHSNRDILSSPSPKFW